MPRHIQKLRLRVHAKMHRRNVMDGCRQVTSSWKEKKKKIEQNCTNLITWLRKTKSVKIIFFIFILSIKLLPSSGDNSTTYSTPLRMHSLLILQSFYPLRNEFSFLLLPSCSGITWNMVYEWRTAFFCHFFQRQRHTLACDVTVQCAVSVLRVHRKNASEPRHSEHLLVHAENENVSTQSIPGINSLIKNI